ncbi:hypothetical protein IT409_02815 [Candidatus Falkowbacteria bacterium]|nr:hypothetical protein [Candidatus Falkowbacteria bacterium]
MGKSQPIKPTIGPNQKKTRAKKGTSGTKPSALENDEDLFSSGKTKTSTPSASAQFTDDAENEAAKNAAIQADSSNQEDAASDSHDEAEKVMAQTRAQNAKKHQRTREEADEILNKIISRYEKALEFIEDAMHDLDSDFDFRRRFDIYDDEIVCALHPAMFSQPDTPHPVATQYSKLIAINYEENGQQAKLSAEVKAPYWEILTSIGHRQLEALGLELSYGGDTVCLACREKLNEMIQRNTEATRIRDEVIMQHILREENKNNVPMDQRLRGQALKVRMRQMSNRAKFKPTRALLPRIAFKRFFPTRVLARNVRAA